MPLTISNNSAVASASYYLDKNQKALQMSIKRLASGKRIVSPNEDPGTLSVVMKLNAAVNRLSGAKNNVQNGISFVEVQDGVLETVGRIVGRMAELKGMATQDPMKSSQDVQSYNNEFVDLQKQLRDVSAQTFNGVSLFADFATGSDGKVTGTQAEFRGNTSADNTIEIFTSSEGSSGTKISLYKSAVLSALTIDASDLTTVNTSVQARPEMYLVCSQAIPEQLSRSASPDYRWECSNRHCPMSLTCVLRPEVVCPA